MSLKKLKPLILVGVLMLPGCATFHSGGIIRTDPVMERKNFEVVGSAQSSSSVFYFLGIPCWRTDLYARANKDLALAAQLSGRSRALVNITRENTYTMYILLFGLQTVSLSANVIEYLDSTATESLQ